MAFIFAFFVVLASSEVISAADTFGTEFAFVFPSRDLVDIYPRVAITNQATVASTILLTVPGLTISSTHTIPIGGSLTIALPVGAIIPATNGLHTDKIVLVTASEPVSVVGDYFPVSTSCGAFTVLPTSTLGKYYIAASYTNDEAESEFVVSALDDNTVVDLTLGGSTVRKTLNQYESYQVFAGGTDFPTATDVTGAFISADKPVVVISGHRFARIPLGVNWRDLIMSQMPPVTSLGTHYVLTPMISQPSGYRYRVIATLCDTDITITPTGGAAMTQSISAGGFYEGSSDAVITVESSDNPVLLAQYCTGGTVYTSPAQGDPCMIIIPSTDMFSGNIAFTALGTTNVEHINIVTECTHANTAFLDGSFVGVGSLLPDHDGSFCVLRRWVSAGRHYVSNSDSSASTLVVQYGNAAGTLVSYGTVAGFDLDSEPTVSFQDITDACTDPGADTATVTWTNPSLTDIGFEDFDCLVVGSTPSPGSSFALGDTTVTVSVASDLTTIELGTFVVTVQDCESPIITPLCAIYAYAEPGSTSDAINWLTPAATDNVDPTVTVTQVTVFTPGQSFPIGTTEVIYSATDIAGNTAMETLKITIIGTDECAGNGLTSVDGGIAKSKITWVPSTQPVLSFQAVSCGALGINLYPFPALGIPGYPLITIETGQTGGIDGSSITYYKNSADSGRRSRVTEAGSQTSSPSLTEYWILIDENEVSVGYKDRSAFISLNKIAIDDIWAALDIRYVEVYGWDGSQYVSSAWCFPKLDSLAHDRTVSSTPCMSPLSDCDLLAIDEDLGTCLLTQASNPGYLQIDLGMEYSIIGITLYHAASTNLAAGYIVDETVFVGSCPGTNWEDIDENVKCGEPTTVNDRNDVSNSDIALYRPCPIGTYGRYVYLVSRSQIDLCEIKVHGIEIPIDNTLMVNFEYTNYNIIEEPVTSAGSGSSITLNLVRTGGQSEVSLTCADVEITDKGSGTATSGVDYVAFPTTTVSFGAGDSKVSVPSVDILPDLLVEESPYETIELEFVDGNGQEQCTTITVVDEDPLYSFDIQEVSMAENDPAGIVTITVSRSKYIDSLTSVRIDTSADTATSVGLNADYTGFVSEQLVFPAGETQRSFDIQIHDDSGLIDYEDEAFDVILDATTENRGEVNRGTVRVTITNDDTIYGLENTESPYGIESEGMITALIKRLGKVDNIGFIGIRTESINGEAIDDIDYEPIDITLTIPAYTYTSIVEIPLIDDLIIEPEETLKLTLYLVDSNTDESPVIDDGSGDAGVETQIVSILDDDNTFSVTSLTNTILESAGSVTVSFSRNNAGSNTATIEIMISGGSLDNADSRLATEGVDFLTTGQHQVVFEPYSEVVDITIPIIQDPNVEYDEEFYVEIIEPVEAINGGRSRTTVLIKNDDAYITVENTYITVLESAGTFLVLLNRGPFMGIEGYLDNDVTIVISTNAYQNDTAIAGYDFEPFTKTVAFLGSAREFHKTCDVIIINDNDVDGDKRFTIGLSGSENIGPSSRLVTVTIVDDDALFALDISSNDISENVGEFEFKATRTGGEASLQRLGYAVVKVLAVSATEGHDFDAGTYNLTFLPRESFKTGKVSIIDDHLPEENEMLRIRLIDVDGEIDEENQEFTLTIIDDDVASFGFERSEYEVGELCQSLKVTVIRHELGQDEATIHLSAHNGGSYNGATYPADYKTRDVSMTFLPNQSRRAVSIEIVSDSLDEGDEIFTLSLSLISGSGHLYPSENMATVTIKDQPVRYFFRDSVVEVVESSGHVTLEVIRSGGVCGLNSIDQYILVSTESKTAVNSEDFVSFSKLRLTFTGDESSAYFDVKLVNDVKVEHRESFQVSIVEPQVTDNTVTIQVLDDDSEYRFLEPKYYTSESEGSVEITIMRMGNVVTDAVVGVRTGDGNATAGADYTPLQNVKVEFDALETSTSFIVDIVMDKKAEGDEIFYVEMTYVTHGDIEIGTTAVVISGDSVKQTDLSSTFLIGIGSGGGLVLLIVIGGIVGMLICRPQSSAVAAQRQDHHQMALFNKGHHNMGVANRRMYIPDGNYVNPYTYSR